MQYTPFIFVIVWCPCPAPQQLYAASCDPNNAAAGPNLLAPHITLSDERSPLSCLKTRPPVNFFQPFFFYYQVATDWRWEHWRGIVFPSKCILQKNRLNRHFPIRHSLDFPCPKAGSRHPTKPRVALITFKRQQHPLSPGTLKELQFHVDSFKQHHPMSTEQETGILLMHFCEAHGQN